MFGDQWAKEQYLIKDKNNYKLKYEHIHKFNI